MLLKIRFWTYFAKRIFWIFAPFGIPNDLLFVINMIINNVFRVRTGLRPISGIFLFINITWGHGGHVSPSPFMSLLLYLTPLKFLVNFHFKEKNGLSQGSHWFILKFKIIKKIWSKVLHWVNLKIKNILFFQFLLICGYKMKLLQLK